MSIFQHSEILTATYIETENGSKKILELQNAIKINIKKII